ncbi:MAG: hypothetical protein GX288_10240 [Clostridiales bacterium]|nr:hypothetical protein [Clostridiales bacterium]
MNKSLNQKIMYMYLYLFVIFMGIALDVVVPQLLIIIMLKQNLEIQATKF